MISEKEAKKSGHLTRRRLLQSGGGTAALGLFSLQGCKTPKESTIIPEVGVWQYGDPLRAQMAYGWIYHPDKKYFRPYIFDPHKEWNDYKEKTWQDYWDRTHFDDLFSGWARDGYNMIAWMHSWSMNPVWQSFILRFEEFPEAQMLSLEESQKVIDHLTWIFAKAKEYGIQNVLYTTLIHYTKAFSEAHGLDKMTSPYSGSRGFNSFGIRNELTRAYTEAAMAEVFQLYPDLDGLMLDVGEELPGERTSFYREAVVPGVKRCGRKPILIVQNWQIPVENYIEGIKSQYENTWLYVHAHNMEVVTDSKPYPYVVDYAERAGIPTVMGFMPSNVQVFPFNSPRFAYEIATELKKVENVIGFFLWNNRWRMVPPGNYLFRKALAHYSQTSEPYMEEPWLELLENRYGDVNSARHFLTAYDLSARIIPETQALIWFPGDIRGLELRIPYEYFVGNLPHRLNRTSPSRGTYLVSVEDYARFVAEDPELYEDREEREGSHQTHYWDYGTFSCTPPVHMAKVRSLGEGCFREAEAALRTVKRGREEALREYNFMKAYKLFSRYYEIKVLAAIYALVYAWSSRPDDKKKAEGLADDTLTAYGKAARFMLDTLNTDVEKFIGRPIGSGGWQYADLPQQIELEKQDRNELAQTFRWTR